MQTTQVKKVMDYEKCTSLHLENRSKDTELYNCFFKINKEAKRRGLTVNEYKT